MWRGAPHPATVGVKLIAPELFDQEPVHELDGLSLDRLDVECTRYQPAPDLLKAQFDEAPVTEVLTSNLLKATAWSPANLTGAACRSATPARRSTRKGCCSTS